MGVHYMLERTHADVVTHSDLAILDPRIPACHSKLIASAVDYGLKTTPETNLHNREIRWPRGKILGGCSSINAL